MLDDIEKMAGPAGGPWRPAGGRRWAACAPPRQPASSRELLTVLQPGVSGAAVLAALAVGGEGRPLLDFIRQSTAGRMTHARKKHRDTPVRRTLDDIAPDSRVFSIIAMDQRNTLRRMFTAVGLDASDETCARQGRRRPRADAAASGLLSDPTYGVPAITEAGALAPNCGLLVAASRRSGAATTASRGPTATRR